MPPITKEYSVLFNEITEVSQELIKLYKRLIHVQQLAEEMYIASDDV